MRRFRRLSPREFWLGKLTLAGVVVLDVLPGLIPGVVVALVLLIYRASRPLVAPLGANPAVPGAFEDIRRHPEAVPVPGVLVARPGAPLSYANAAMIRETIDHAVAASPGPVRTVVLDLDANDDIDITSAEQLTKLADSLHARSVAFGLLAKIGSDRVFQPLPAAVAWAQSAATSPGRLN